MRTNVTTDLSVLIEGKKNESEAEVQKEKTGPRKMYAAAVAALTFPIALGMAAAYSATATENMKLKSSAVIPNEEEVSWIGSLVALGALVGGLISGYLSNNFGRKGGLVLSSAPFLVGWLLIAYASNVWLIFVGRFVTGICVGLICVTAPAYLVEISTPEIRGLLGASFQLFIVIGVLIVTSLGSILTWNYLAVAGAVSVLCALCAIYVVPESPRWLIANGRYQEAIEAVTFLQGPYFDAAAECVSINEDICLQPKGKITLKEFIKPSVYKPALLSIGLVFFQQFCGSNAILFYTVAIFKESRSSLDPDLSSIIVDAVLVIATAVSTVLMDKAGRKILLIISSACMTVSLASLGSYEIMKAQNVLQDDYNWVPLVCVMAYIAAFSLGFGPIPWLMMAEMSPVRVRSFIGGIATALCWAFTFIVTKTFDNLVHSICDYGTYFLYGGFSLLACVFSAFFLPETKGKPFEEIQEFFANTRISYVNPTN